MLITIVCHDGKTTTAGMVDEATETYRMSGARLHPHDRYDTYEGARIALARLFGKEPFEEMAAEEQIRKPKYKKGQIVEAIKTVYGKYRSGDLGSVLDPGCNGVVKVGFKSGEFFVTEGAVKPFEGQTRMRPRVGDTVVVVNPQMTAGRYQRGDIGWVTQASNVGAEVRLPNGNLPFMYWTEIEVIDRGKK